MCKPLKTSQTPTYPEKYLDRAPKGSKLSQKAKDKKSEYSGLEHRQTLRTMTSIVICKLKSKIYSWKLGIEKLET